MVSNELQGAGQGALAGAAAGSAFGPVGTGIGAVAGGLLGFFGGQSASRTAEAQGRAAEAQLAEARRTRDLASAAAAASPAELESRASLLALQQQVLGRTNRELDFLSRGLASQTGGQSLQGEGLFSELIARNRQSQRRQLEATLRARFGAGYATTSAGIQALNQFDQQTVDIGVQAIPQFLNTAYGSIGQTTSLENVLSSRSVNAINATPTTPYAGAPYVGQIAANQARSQMFGSLLSAGSQLGVAALANPNLFKSNGPAPEAETPKIANNLITYGGGMPGVPAYGQATGMDPLAGYQTANLNP